MDLFKFKSVDDFRDGEAINGANSISWVERYRKPGDFEIVAPLSSGLRGELTPGTLISHLNTMEIMVVENRQIMEDEDSDPEIKITGRSFEVYLDNRMVGQNQNWASPPATLDASNYELAAQDTWLQAVEMIRDHIVEGVTLDVDDSLSQVEATSDVSGIPGTSEARTIKRGPVHQRLIEILEIDDLGIRVVRSNKFNTDLNSLFTHLVVHNGEDKRKTVVFSDQAGDITSADYLWTIKNHKNAALVTGRFVETLVTSIKTGFGYNRRFMFVDAQDLDGHLTAVPTGAALTAMRAKMATRGRQAIADQKELFFSVANISVMPTYRYRHDYNMGDIIAIDGSFGEKVPMRVVEYAEIEDENGSSGHPTLAMLEEE